MPRKNAKRPTAADLKVRAMAQELKEAAQTTESADPLAKYLVMSFDYRDDDSNSTLRTRIYLLPAHAHFPGFGGSRGGLVTGKTPSLIMRQTGGWGIRDTEYDLCCPKAWGYINWLARKAAIQGSYHVIGSWDLIDPSQHPKAPDNV